MTCEEIEGRDIPDRYMLGNLSPSEMSEFEEHYLGCQKCAEKLTETDAFIASLLGYFRKTSPNGQVVQERRPRQD